MFIFVAMKVIEAVLPYFFMAAGTRLSSVKAYKISTNGKGERTWERT